MRKMMRNPAWLCGLAVLVAGCGPTIDNSDIRSTGSSHFIRVANLTDNPPPFSTDRTVNARSVEVTVKRFDGEPRSVDVAVTGAMDGGTAIPDAVDLPVTTPPRTPADRLPKTATGDQFIGDPYFTGKHYQTNAYFASGNFPNGPLSIGVVAAGEATANVPTSGRATYRGPATVFAVGGGNPESSFLSGRSELLADFDPAVSSVNGSIKELQAGAFGHDIILDRAPIDRGAFTGQARMVARNTNAASATIAASGYTGQFFGPGAAEAAGTLYIDARNIDLGEGNVPRVEFLGVFGGEK